MLGRNRARAVTITGPGGVGKTRLATAAAQELVESYDDGVTFVDLAPIRELGLMTAKPYIYVFNVDEAVLTDAARLAELEALVAPAHAVFLDAKIESELIDLDPEDAAELLASTGQEESGIDQLARIGFDGFATGGDALPLLGFTALAAGEHDTWEPLTSQQTTSTSQQSTRNPR